MRSLGAFVTARRTWRCDTRSGSCSTNPAPPARIVRGLSVLCPAVPEVREHHRRLVRRFIGEWGFDGHKLDAVFTMPRACHNPRHRHRSPDDSLSALGALYAEILSETRALNPGAVVQICPCGTPPHHAWLPFLTQAVAADPVGERPAASADQDVQGAPRPDGRRVGRPRRAERAPLDPRRRAAQRTRLRLHRRRRRGPVDSFRLARRATRVRRASSSPRERRRSSGSGLPSTGGRASPRAPSGTSTSTASIVPKAIASKRAGSCTMPSSRPAPPKYSTAR